MENGPDELVSRARQVLADQPEPALRAALDAWIEAGSGTAANDLGTALVRLGHKELAELAYRRALELSSDLYKPYNNLGNLLLERGEAQDAIQLLRKAASLAPDQPRVWLNLGNALAAAEEDPDEAIAAYDKSIALAPMWKAFHNKGAILLRIGQVPEAIEAFEGALALDPAALGTAISLAEALTAAGRRSDAEGVFRDVSTRLPQEPHVVANLIAALETRYFDELAVEVAEKALDSWPGDETLLLLYVFLLERNGQLERAEARLAALSESDETPAPLLHLARLRARQFRYGDEAELIARATERFPDHPAVLAQQARMLRHAQKLDDAIEVLERLTARPDCSTDALEALAGTFLDVGDARRAYDQIKRAEAMAKSWKMFSRSMLAFVSNAVSGLSADEVAAAHRGFPTARQAALPNMQVSPRSRAPGRRLRLGYVSPDFRAHSVGMFIEPILRAHDREKLEIYCYSTTTLPHDGVTARIRQLDLTFRDMKKASDFDFASRIVDDEIDVLVDLAGWTSEQRMFVFQMCPAPVRVTYLGYPNTTGLAEMQYRITDTWADPPSSDRLFTEELVRLPRCAWAFDPVDDPGEVRERPADAPIVFGSFNNLQKLSEATLDLWARVLQAVPGSRLLLKSKQLMHRRAKERITGELAARGIDPSRLELLERIAGHQSHLACYGEMDIGLDPFPYNGTTTTCEALLMGIPVVSLVGDTPASRVGYSLLRAIGLPELCCDSEAAYIDKAVELASDRGRLSDLRRTLRSRMKTSELGDTVALTRALEDAYRSLWRRYVEST